MARRLSSRPFCRTGSSRASPRFLKAFGTAKLRIEAFADNVGDPAENKKTSLARATAVRTRSACRSTWRPDHRRRRGYWIVRCIRQQYERIAIAVNRNNPKRPILSDAARAILRFAMSLPSGQPRTAYICAFEGIAAMPGRKTPKNEIQVSKHSVDRKATISMITANGQERATENLR